MIGLLPENDRHNLDVQQNIQEACQGSQCPACAEAAYCVGRKAVTQCQRVQLSTMNCYWLQAAALRSVKLMLT